MEIVKKGYFPSRLSINLEIADTGEKTLTFLEWHKNLDDKLFEIVLHQTQIVANQILAQNAHLKMDVKFKAFPEQKSFKVTYTGKRIEPAISAIFFELMPQLVSDEKDAFKAINLLFQAVQFCLQTKIVQPYSDKKS